MTKASLPNSSCVPFIFWDVTQQTESSEVMSITPAFWLVPLVKSLKSFPMFEHILNWGTHDTYSLQLPKL